MKVETKDILRKKTENRPSRTCVRCKTNPSTARINMVVLDIDPETSKKGKTVVSKSKTFCDSCCIEIWEQLMKDLDT